MTTGKRIAWSTLILVNWGSCAFPVYAIDLNGAWATDSSVCAKVFVKEMDTVGFRKDSDIYGGGFIVEGNYIRGQGGKCEIKARNESGGTIHLLASCSTDIMYSNMEFSMKVINDNQIVRIFPGMPDITLSYSRCSF
jgi:hypothetical protein